MIIIKKTHYPKKNNFKEKIEIQNEFYYFLTDIQEDLPKSRNLFLP